MVPLRVLILADDPLVRAGLALLLTTVDLNTEGGITVVGTAAPDEIEDGSSPRGGIPSPMEVFSPEILLWDLGTDPQSAVVSWNRLTASMAQSAGQSASTAAIPIVYLLPDAARIELHPRAGLDREGLGWGLLRRQSSPGTILHALQCALDGLGIFDPALVSLNPDPGAENMAPRYTIYDRTDSLMNEMGLSETLTSRELQVLKLIAEGLSNKQAAQALGIRENTVKFHVNAILGKLHAASRTEAVTRAARAGWLAL